MDITATTSRMWINPLIVYDVTMPSNHNTIRTIAIVPNICFYLCQHYGASLKTNLATIAHTLFNFSR